MNIKFYNTTRLDKTDDEFVRNPDWKAVGSWEKVNDKYFYKILSEIIPKKLVKVPFQDMELLKEETFQLLEAFGKAIEKLLQERDLKVETNSDIEFRGNIYELDLRNHHRHIILTIRTYNLLEECLNDNKPVYLSITKGEE